MIATKPATNQAGNLATKQASNQATKQMLLLAYESKTQAGKKSKK